jgi:hypothetical protein
MSLDVRIATPHDFDGLMTLVRLAHADNGQHAFSETKIRESIAAACRMERAIIGVIGPADDLRAAIHMIINEIYYSDDVQLFELWTFVREDSRRSDFAKKLLQFAKDCAEQAKLDLLIGIISDQRLEEKERLYKRTFQKAGTFFVHHGAQAA